MGSSCSDDADRDDDNVNDDASPQQIIVLPCHSNCGDHMELLPIH
jgi:hypothetical protein